MSDVAVTIRLYVTDVVKDTEYLSVDDIVHSLHIYLLIPTSNITQYLHHPIHIIYKHTYSY